MSYYFNISQRNWKKGRQMPGTFKCLPSYYSTDLHTYIAYNRGLWYPICPLKINCPGYFTVSPYTFGTPFFWWNINDSSHFKVLIWVIHSVPVLKLDPTLTLFYMTYLIISHLAKKTKMHGFLMFRGMNFVHTSILY